MTVIYSKTIGFGKVDYAGNGRHSYPADVDVELRQREGTEGNGRTELSICGNIWNTRKTDCVSCGQNIDTLLELVPGKKMRRIHEVWSEWHLNGMKAGTPAQTAIVKAARLTFAPYPASDYDQCLAVLEAAGLLYDPAEDRDNGPDKPRGYKYGSEWLFRELPETIIAEVLTW
jgi:hypothetical protein